MIAISICFAGMIFFGTATIYFGNPHLMNIDRSIELAGILLCLAADIYCTYRHYRP